MSFHDNLENDLKNLENRAEADPASERRTEGRRQSDRAAAVASAPHAEKLKNGKFTSDLLKGAARIGFSLRTKVHIIWIGPALRLEAREHRLELRPAPEGVWACWSVGGVEKKKERADLGGSGEALAKKWLETVGPPPRAPEVPPELLEELQTE